MENAFYTCTVDLKSVLALFWNLLDKSQILRKIKIVQKKIPTKWFGSDIFFSLFLERNS